MILATFTADARQGARSPVSKEGLDTMLQVEMDMVDGGIRYWGITWGMRQGKTRVYSRKSLFMFETLLRLLPTMYAWGLSEALVLTRFLKPLVLFIIRVMFSFDRQADG